MFDTFDRTGSAEFPFPKQVVYRALCEAVPLIAGMKIQGRDDLACRLDVATSISLFSWGERVSIAVSSLGEHAAGVSVQSGAKTILGSATTHGRNRKNVRDILSQASRVLSEKGDSWRGEMGLNTHAQSTTSSIAGELAKLATLREQGVLNDVEFQAAKARLLSA